MSDTAASPEPEPAPAHEHCTTNPPLDPNLQSSGEIIEINGVETYVSKPADFEDAEVLFFFTNGVGHKSLNNQLQADEYAKEGMTVLMPDLFEGDPAPTASSVTAESDAETLLDKVKFAAVGGIKVFLIDMWLARRTPEKTIPVVERFVAGVKEKYAEQVKNGVYAVGYCFGAKYALHVNKIGEVKAAAIAHGIVNVEDFKGLKAPISIAAVDGDQYFPNEAREEAVKVLEAEGVEHEVKVYEGVPHGFAVLGSYKDSKIQSAQKSAWEQMLDWISAH